MVPAPCTFGARLTAVRPLEHSHAQLSTQHAPWWIYLRPARPSATTRAGQAAAEAVAAPPQLALGRRRRYLRTMSGIAPCEGVAQPGAHLRHTLGVRTSQTPRAACLSTIARRCVRSSSKPRLCDLGPELEWEVELAADAGRDRDRDARPFGGTTGGRRRAANAANASAAVEGSSVDVILGVIAGISSSPPALAVHVAAAVACGACRGSKHISHSRAAGLLSNVQALHVHADAGGALALEEHLATLRFFAPVFALVRRRDRQPPDSESSSGC